MYEFPWLLNGQQGINNNVSSGFRDAQLSDGITSIRDGISGLSTQLCGCCGDISTQLCNGFNGIGMQLANGTIADLERSFAAQTAVTGGLTNISAQLAQCCCDNRAATQDVKYTIATEACATRAANTQNTQAILDKLCALELDGYSARTTSFAPSSTWRRSMLPRSRRPPNSGRVALLSSTSSCLSYGPARSPRSPSTAASPSSPAAPITAGATAAAA